jgi:hypothetical protein
VSAVGVGVDHGVDLARESALHSGVELDHHRSRSTGQVAASAAIAVVTPGEPLADAKAM